MTASDVPFILTTDSCEVGEQRDARPGGADGAKDRAQGESEKPKHAPDTGPGKRVTGGRSDTAVCTTGTRGASHGVSPKLTIQKRRLAHHRQAA